MTTFLHTNLGGLLGPDHDKISYVKMKVEGIAKQIEKVVQLAPHHPQQVFTVLRLSTLAQATYLQRTVDVPPDIYQPIDTAMANTAIPYLLKWEHITEAQIQMVSLPFRDGGLGLPKIADTAVSQFKGSREATGVLSALMMSRVSKLDDTQRQAHDSHIAKSSAKARKSRKEVTKMKSKSLVEGNNLPHVMARALARAKGSKESSVLFSLLPSTLLGTVLDEVVFRDAITVRYSYPTLNGTSDKCSADNFDADYDLEHACSCKKGGNIIANHDDVMKALQQVGLTVLRDT